MKWIGAGMLPTSWNWYDYVVAVALATGIYTGLRAGLLQSLWRAVTWGLMSGAGLLLYLSVGPWMQDLFGVGTDTANLQAFVVLGILVYIPCHLVAREIMIRSTQRPLPAMADNWGGALVGPLAMFALAVWISLVLVLTRNAFWYQEVAVRSYIGARIVQRFPPLAVAPKKDGSEQPWFLQPIQRRQEPTPDTKGPR